MSTQPAADLLQQFQRVDTGRNWQKVCAAEDWHDPAFQFVLREVLRRGSNLHRKQWEFVAIVATLLQKGLLTPSARGVSFGAGRELPLFAISRLVKHLTATDLYELHTGWKTARLKENQSPTDYVLAGAKEPVDQARLSAKQMDMRDLDFDDHTFDFAYSSCAFEHIGTKPDFLRHLREVRRVLKPDGCYVMTTEFVFGKKTYPIKGNHKFAAEDLLTMAADAGLAADPVLDCNVEKSPINRPRIPVHALGLPVVQERALPGIILQTDGVPYTSCLLALTPSEKKAKTTIDGRLRSANFLQRSIKRQQNSLFRTWQRLRHDSRLRVGPPANLTDHADYLVEAVGGRLAKRKVISTDFIAFPAGDGEFRVSIRSASLAPKIIFTIVSRQPMTVWPGRPRHRVVVKRPKLRGSPYVTIPFKADGQAAYSLIAKVPSKQAGFSDEDMVTVEVRVAET